MRHENAGSDELGYQSVPHSDAGRFKNCLVMVHEGSAQVGPVIPSHAGRKVHARFTGWPLVEQHDNIAKLHPLRSARRRPRHDLRDGSAIRI
jgi:hypothetical protein